jgi:hypothetical protein
MNDTELDRLLDTWEAPASPPSLRERLRARFPRTERRKLTRPLGWVLVAAAASLTLAIGMEQTRTNPWDFQIGEIFQRLHMHLYEAFEAHRAAYLRSEIRAADPKVYVDGQPAPPLEYGGGARMDVQVPGDGVYSVLIYSLAPAGWAKAGRIHGNVIEFQAGTRQVRIECNRQIVSDNRPVFVRRRQ